MPLGMSWERLDKQILSLFAAIPLSGVSLGMSWERPDKQILSLFAVIPPSRFWRYLRDLRHFGLDWEVVGKDI